MCGLLLPLQKSVQAQTAEAPLIHNVQDRDRVVLDGNWNIIIDPYKTGMNPNSGYMHDNKMENPWDRIEYNFDTGDQLDVPGDWNTQQDKLFFYEGSVWYKKTFEYEEAEGQREFLYFGAVNYEADIYLNGEKAGSHVGGFTPFNVEIKDLLQEGENTLVVRADNERRSDGVPGSRTDWWNYGGITRSVSFVKVPETFIENYFIQLADNSEQTIGGWIQLNGSTAGEQELTVEISELDISETIRTDENGRAEFKINAEPELWSPEEPKLYSVEIESTNETIADKIGFRTIEQKGEDILLNGEPVFLRGVSIHEERPFGDGRAFSEEHASTLLGWAKEMNANFVRLAHYPHNEHMLKIADELGLMVWSEIPVYWALQFDNPDVYSNAEQQLTEMINRDHNRASVILWSVANETPANEDRLEFLTGLVNKVYELDPTRLTTSAFHTQRLEDGVTYIEDPMADVVDVIGINNYCGWYGSSLPDECSSIRWESEYNKPVIMSEFGGGALHGYHGSELDRWTEEYQESVFKYNLEMIENISFLRGTVPWLLVDFRSPRRPLARIQDFYNRKGLISENGARKKAFFLMQDWYLDNKQNWHEKIETH